MNEIDSPSSPGHCLLDSCARAWASAIGRPGDDKVTLARVPNGGIQPEVAVDAAGVIHMVYFSGEPRAGNLYYVRSSDFGKSAARTMGRSLRPAA